jgi:hypothetical protein
MRAKLEVHERVDRALQRADVGVLDVPPVLAQVGRDAVGATAFARFRRARGIGLVGLARLAQRRDVINVDVEPHAPLPSDHFVNRKVMPVMRRLAPFQLFAPRRAASGGPTARPARHVGTALAVLAALGSLGCGSRPQAPPAPQSINETVVQFMAAVKANDLQRMGALWGTERGPAVDWMKAEELRMRLTVIQKYLAYDGYRILEGPLSVPGHDDMRTFKVELQRQQCNTVATLDLKRAGSGGWLVSDPHLETLSNPAAQCKPRNPGTGS